MPPVSFGTELDLKLIGLVKQYPVVYETKHEDCLQPNKREEAWEKIGKGMGKSALACKTRWVNMRDNLRRKIRTRERKRPRKSKSEFRYKYEDELTFILPYFKGPLIESTEDETNEYADNVESTEMEMSSMFMQSENRYGLEYSYELDVKPDVSALISSQMGNRNYNDTDASSSKRCCTAVSTSQDAKSEDPIGVFLEAVGSTMRSLNPYYLNQAKSRIFQVVQDCELQQIVNKGDPPTSS